MCLSSELKQSRLPQRRTSALSLSRRVEACCSRENLWFSGLRIQAFLSSVVRPSLGFYHAHRCRGQQVPAGFALAIVNSGPGMQSGEPEDPAFYNQIFITQATSMLWNSDMPAADDVNRENPSST